MKTKVIQILFFCVLSGCFSSAAAEENLTQEHRDYLQQNALLILNDREIRQIREQLLYYGKNQENLSASETETLQKLATQLNEKIKEMIPRYMNGYRNVPEKYLEKAAKREERRKRYQEKYSERQAEQVSRVTETDIVEVEESTKRFQSSLQDNRPGNHDIEVQEVPSNTSLYDFLNPTVDNPEPKTKESGERSNLQKSIPF